MPDYQVRISKSAQRQLNKLPDSVAGLLIETMSELSGNPRPHGCKKLKGRSGYRIRKGDYRIIYDIFDKFLVIEVVAIGDRKDIYE